MTIISKNAHGSRGLASLAVVASLTVGCLLASAAPASAQGVYWSRADLLRSFFRVCDKVTYERFELTPAQRGALKKQLGAEPKRDWTVYYGVREGRVAGYAIIDEELGQHLPITFGVLVSPDGRVDRVEVMVYRESHGDAIREARFRRQFKGKRAVDRMRAGREIAAISGATISAKSMSAGVRRALSVVDALVLQPGRKLAGSR